jgi:hypothetical protein
MALTITQKLAGLGMAGPQVKELVAQITAETGNAKRLVNIGFPTTVAKELASQITLGATPPTKPVNRLCNIGVDPQTAELIVAQIAIASA